MKKLLATLAVLLCVCVGTVAMRWDEKDDKDLHKETKTLIVAEHSFTDQTTSIPTTTLFTPTEAGLYRISTYEDQSNNFGSYGPEEFLSWTDDFASNNTQIFGNDEETVGTTGWGTHQITVRGIANHPIQFNTLINPNQKGTYNVYVVVEQL